MADDDNSERARRFARQAETQPNGADAVSVEDATAATELLDRLERQAAEVARLTTALAEAETELRSVRATAESAAKDLDVERKERKRLAELLERERAAHAEAAAQAEGAATLKHQLQLAWAQLTAAEDELAKQRRPLVSRMLHRD